MSKLDVNKKKLVLSEHFDESFSGSVSGLSSVNLDIPLSRTDFTSGELMLKHDTISTSLQMACFIAFTDTPAQASSVSTVLNYETLRWSPSFYASRNTWRVGGFWRTTQDRLSRDLIPGTVAISGGTDDRHCSDCFITGATLRVVLTNEQVTTWNYAFQIIGRVYKHKERP